MFRKEHHQWNLIFFLPGHVIESLLHKEESSLIFSAKKLNCIGEKFVPHTVCLLSEVNRYTAELSFGPSRNTFLRRAQMSTEVCIKLFTRRTIKCQDRRRRSLSISLNFYQTILESSLQMRFLFDITKLLLLIIDALILFPEKQRKTCLNSVEFPKKVTLLIIVKQKVQYNPQCCVTLPQVSLLFTLLPFITTWWHEISLLRRSFS